MNAYLTRMMCSPEQILQKQQYNLALSELVWPSFLELGFQYFYGL